MNKACISCGSFYFCDADCEKSKYQNLPKTTKLVDNIDLPPIGKKYFPTKNGNLYMGYYEDSVDTHLAAIKKELIEIRSHITHPETYKKTCDLIAQIGKTKDDMKSIIELEAAELLTIEGIQKITKEQAQIGKTTEGGK